MKNSIKSVLSIVTLATACCTSQAAVSTIGGPITNPANGHKYYVISEAIWSDAEAYAMTLGGHLATINDAAENAWVFANVIATDPNRNPWIGLTAPSVSGPWTWVSGEVSTYTNWGSGEPNGVGAPPYGVNVYPLSHPSAGQWNDAPKYDAYQGIVEVPEPSLMGLGLVGALGFFLKRGRRN